MYRQLRRGVSDPNYQLVDANKSLVPLCLENPTQDLYTSFYKYSEAQKQIFNDQHGSVKGIKDVVTEYLVWDFDNKENPELAQNDAVLLCERLEAYGIPQDALRISFSGNKGFHVEVKITSDITVDEFKNITRGVASDLPTFDKSVFDHARPFRILGSYNSKSGLYKIPLNDVELFDLSINQIREIAKTQDRLKGTPFKWTTVSLPEQLAALAVVKEVELRSEVVDTATIDWSHRPKGFPNCRWAIYNGLFKQGERHSAMMVLVSFFKNQGETKETAYHRACGSIELQAKKNNCPEVDKGTLYREVIESVYSPDWKNGQYSCREKGSWLANYCISLGGNKCKHKEDESTFIEIDEFASKFTNFAQNIDQNRLKFGIDDIDNRVMVTTSMLVGLLGAPSAGKTTLLLNFLEQTNRDGIDSVFFSMDMSLPLVYLRLIQKNFGYSKDKVFELFLKHPNKAQEVVAAIKERYKYTKFSFKTGMTVEGMREAVQDHEDKIQRKVKLVGVDYLECINGPYSDSTANSGLIGNQLKDVANDLDTCVMLLLQTQKQSGDPSDPLLSMRNVKGSSVVEQACSVIMSLSRPGFSPTHPEDDKFATISTVKDRMGSLMTVDVGWNGMKGEFYKLPDEDAPLLATVRERKKQETTAKSQGWG